MGTVATLRFKEAKPAQFDARQVVTKLMAKAQKASLRVGAIIARFAKSSIRPAKKVKTRRGTILRIPSAPGTPPRIKTGRLKESIQFAWDPGRRKVYVGPTVNYGAKLEFGTRKMSARPYMEPAFKRAQGKIRDAYKAAA